MAEGRLQVHQGIVAAGSRALVIDPDRDAASRLTTTLERLGFRTTSAPGWPQTARHLNEQRVDWIFCDATKLMELDVIHEVLRTRPSRRIIALIQGGRVANLGRAMLALERGAHDFLIKPAQIEAVAGVVLSLRRPQ